jgi:hypothetical protein
MDAGAHAGNAWQTDQTRPDQTRGLPGGTQEILHRQRKVIDDLFTIA